MAPHPLLAVATLPVKFAVPPVPDVPTFVDQVDTGPHRIAPPVPILPLVVDHDWKAEFCFSDLGLQFRELFFGCGFGGVHSNDGQSTVAVILLPPPVPGVVANAVDSAKSPEMERDDFALQVGDAQVGGVNGPVGGNQFRSLETHLA